jgi:hypothetical protein
MQSALSQRMRGLHDLQKNVEARGSDHQFSVGESIPFLIQFLPLFAYNPF